MHSEIEEYFKLAFRLRRQSEGHPLVAAVTRDKLQELAQKTQNARLKFRASQAAQNSPRDMVGLN